MPSTTLPLALRTPRLLLRCWRPGDAPLLKAALDASLAHLQSSVEWARHEPTPVEQLAQRLAGFAADFNSRGEWLFGILPPDESRVLGGCAADAAEPALTALVGDGAVELGYWLRADATGRGYATEATAALAHAVFASLGALRVVVCHDPANTGSGAVARRLGFHCLGSVTAAELPGRRGPDGSLRAATTVWVRDADSKL